MSENRKEGPIQKPSATPEVHSGIRKSEEEKRELETRIGDTMRRLGTRLTKKEILSLASKIEASRGLDDLKKSLESDSEITKEIPEETLKAVMELVRQARELAESGLKELKLDLGKTNVGRDYEIDKNAYFSNRFPWIKRFEESELGKNAIVDVEGFLLGTLDSAASIVKLLFLLLKDFFLLPADAYRAYSEKRGGPN